MSRSLRITAPLIALAALFSPEKGYGQDKPVPLPPKPIPVVPVEPFGIEGPDKVDAHRLVKLKAKGMDPKAGLLWRVSGKVDRADTTKGTLQFAAPPGTYDVELLQIRLTPEGVTEVEESRLTITVGNPAPPPVPPGPVPPGPNPPGPAPIPVAGLHVLIVYESAETLPAGQVSAIYGEQMRKYLNEKCATGPDGKTKTWRIFDKDLSIDGDDKVWADAMKRPRKSLPWLIVSNGKDGYEGELPKSLDETLAILKKYGG